jgi:hypothetical protein
MTLDMGKLRKLLLVMLSADQAGEIAAASAAITKALKADGKDIHWLADKLVSGAPMPSPNMPPPWWQGYPPPEPRRPQPPPKREPQEDPWPTRGWRMDLLYCAARVTMLRDREMDFIRSLVKLNNANLNWRPTKKQGEWLDAIARRLRDESVS